jgi:hypothetical protein
MMAISARARWLAEGLWWVMVSNEPYHYWKSEKPSEGELIIMVNNRIVDPHTGEILANVDQTGSQ